jgi:hypothetical protein
MHTPSHARRAASVRAVPLSLLACLCAGLWCTAPFAAAEPGVANQPAPAPTAPPGQPAQAGATPGGSSSGAAVRRLAIGGAVAFGLWQAWRASRTEAGPRAESAAPPPAIFDPDRPLPMDGVMTVAELEDYSIRRLMDTLRALRASKQNDCDRGKTSQDFFCAKIRLVKAALGLKGVTWFGDESHDGCECR